MADYEDEENPHDKKTSRFLIKTFKMVSDPNNANIVSWTDSGDEFVVKNEHDFASILLPLNFRHKNFSSFVRQLNFYGFRKRTTNNQHSLFTHPNFRRDRSDLLPLIKRKVGDPAAQPAQVKVTLETLQKQVDELQRQYSDIWKLQHHILFYLSRTMSQDHIDPRLPAQPMTTPSLLEHVPPSNYLQSSAYNTPRIDVDYTSGNLHGNSGMNTTSGSGSSNSSGGHYNPNTSGNLSNYISYPATRSSTASGAGGSSGSSSTSTTGSSGLPKTFPSLPYLEELDYEKPSKRGPYTPSGSSTTTSLSSGTPSYPINTFQYNTGQQYTSLPQTSPFATKTPDAFWQDWAQLGQLLQNAPPPSLSGNTSKYNISNVNATLYNNSAGGASGGSTSSLGMNSTGGFGTASHLHHSNSLLSSGPIIEELGPDSISTNTTSGVKTRSSSYAMHNTLGGGSSSSSTSHAITPSMPINSVPMIGYQHSPMYTSKGNPLSGTGTGSGSTNTSSSSSSSSSSRSRNPHGTSATTGNDGSASGTSTGSSSSSASANDDFDISTDIATTKLPIPTLEIIHSDFVPLHLTHPSASTEKLAFDLTNTMNTGSTTGTGTGSGSGSSGNGTSSPSDGIRTSGTGGTTTMGGSSSYSTALITKEEPTDDTSGKDLDLVTSLHAKPISLSLSNIAFPNHNILTSPLLPTTSILSSNLFGSASTASPLITGLQHASSSSSSSSHKQANFPLLEVDREPPLVDEIGEIGTSK